MMALAVCVRCVAGDWCHSHTWACGVLASQVRHILTEVHSTTELDNEEVREEGGGALVCEGFVLLLTPATACYADRGAAHVRWCH